MTTEKKAEKALLMAGYSGSLFHCIATNRKPADGVTRLAAALTVTPNADPKKRRQTLSIDGDAVKQVVQDYYADQKATDETSDNIDALAETETESDDE